eukprot:TRINITY_DN1300_c0_g4_i1.p1 TRINITY_DN1300_c0_g4~~TRINITY_DN1300_c0_g4_i1.p1  ORF type:complete len:319 (+),score=43.25 TRINITY_DN1300_c0_g4_i1:337-1293(+)
MSFFMSTGLFLGAAAIAVGCGLVAVRKWMVRNAENIQIAKYTLNGGIHSSSTVRLLQVSDVHYDSNEAPFLMNVLRKVVGFARSEQPDFILLTGDYVNKNSKPCEMFSEKWVRQLASTTTPVLAILGNHDACGPTLIKGYLQNAGATVLTNQTTVQHIRNAKVVFTGLADYYSSDWQFAKEAVRGGLEKATGGFLLVIMSHNPDTAPLITEWVEDFRQSSSKAPCPVLILSGHTHGGQICFPTGYPVLACLQKVLRLFRVSRYFWLARVANVVQNWEFASGMHRLAPNITLIVSRGVGSHSAARAFCPPDTTLVDCQW